MRCGPRRTRRDALPAWRRRDMRAPPRHSPKPYRSVPCSGCRSGLSAGAAQLVKEQNLQFHNSTVRLRCLSRSKYCHWRRTPYASSAMSMMFSANDGHAVVKGVGCLFCSHLISAPESRHRYPSSLSLLVRACGSPSVDCPSCLRQLSACRAAALSLRRWRVGAR